MSEVHQGQEMNRLRHALKNSRQQFKSVIEEAVLPSMLLNRDGKILMFSKSMEEIWGIKSGDFNESYSIFQDEQLRDAGILPLIDQSFAGNVNEGIEILYDPLISFNTGRSRWVKANSYPIFDDKQDVIAVIITLEDITILKEDKEKGLQSQEVLKSFMDAVSDTLVIYDKDLNYIEINEVARSQINLKKEDIIGKNLCDMIPGIEKTDRYKKYQEVIKNGKSFQVEVFNHPFSPNRTILIKAFKVNDGVGIITTDITSAKNELNRELNINKELKFLKDSALDLVEFSYEEDIYSYCAKKLSTLLKNSFVLVNMLDPKTNRVIIKGVSGEAKIQNEIDSLISFQLIDKDFAYYKDQERLITGRLEKTDQGLFEISGGEIPQSLCSTIEKALDLKEIYSIGFIRNEVLYGNVLIFTFEEEIKYNSNLIEAFINQISIAIHRIVSERALLESEHRFEKAFTASPDSVNVNRLEDGVYVDVNDGFMEITGYTREEVIGKSSLELEIWSDTEARKRLTKELSEKGIVRNMESTFKTKSGELKVGLISANIIAKDGIEHIISITRDISDRINAENLLRASEERYRVVAYQTGQIIYDYNIESGEISWVGAIEEVTGYTPEEFSGVYIDQWRELLHPEDIEGTSLLLEEAIHGYGNFNAEYRLRRKDGNYVHIEEHGMCIGSPETKSRRMLGSMADITERKEYNQSMEAAWKKAQESDRLKTAFLANLSHEIRTPMNAILGFSDLLMNPNIRENDRFEYIKIINKSSHNLLGIINDILDFSMIETGQLQIYRKACSLQEILNELQTTFMQFKRMEGQDHIQLYLQESLANTNDLIISDEDRIKQVMTNLLGNALKYTEEGEIRFGWNLKPVGNGRLQIEFFVSDTGIGISKDKHEMIFERFRQLDDSNTRVYSGNGLGLAISKQIANLLDGDITLSSEQGKGSVFYFTLPYLPAREKATLFQNDVHINDYNWEKKSFIVAEDVRSNFYLIKSILEKTAVKLTWAKNGKEAVEAYKNANACDCILMDVRMPEMNGYEATMEIRKIDSSVPIIALSANAMAKDIEKSLQVGCNDHISKPISFANLFITISKYVK